MQLIDPTTTTALDDEPDEDRNINEPASVSLEVLIADDNALTRRRVEAAVSGWGHTPITVGDGTSAWEVLNSDDAPQIAILDWRMPGLEGAEICRRVRSRASTRYTYLILLTNRTDRDSLIEGLTAGADDYVRQPFDAAELEQRLRTAQRIVDLQNRLLDAQRSLHLRATRDSLTGLWNRGEILRFLEQEAARAHREQKSVGVLMIDVDHFKTINDRYGHLAGDEVLRQVSSTIASQVRRCDQVGRYGGEEFLVLMPGADAERALRIAERVRRTVDSQSIDHNDRCIEVGISIGVACCDPTRPDSVQRVIQQADDALYRAKNAGRNCSWAAVEDATNLECAT